ncbi:hypothetical protein NIE88_20745 [Sporolactobacillus shoreicorticis]|uniref:Phage protein n=1 Tax=Sporolactobacillus shoreicorticis TaxID=1923877 RepID=A0ABW5S635_9BACL|nr:hypothetical protein [Sporolactobacillus shoreicorticis]MCO7128177.1 hypothetical protein [Sporolactobacillus shoreicorticis]
MVNWNASKAMIEENNRKLNALRKYETDHHNDLPASSIYWAVDHEIEYLERQNKELKA